MPTFKDSAKAWFRKFLYPTAVQFAQTFDWIRWKDEAIAQADVEGLEDLIYSLDHTLLVATKDTEIDEEWVYKIPAGHVLEYMVIEPEVTCTASIKDYKRDEMLIENDEIVGDDDMLWELFLSAKADRNIGITGLPIRTKIKIIKRRITQ